MIVRQFLSWIRTAPPSDRAEGARALARSYLYSELGPDDRAAAEGALLLLLDDPSPLVRLAMADVFAASHHAPPAIVAALVADQTQVALPLLRHSPMLLDSDLVDLVATGTSDVQCAIAGRLDLPRSVAAAIAEVGHAAACLALIENNAADIATLSLERIAQRYGSDAVLREALLVHPQLSANARHGLVLQVSQLLSGFVVQRGWISASHAERVVKESCERATVTVAADAATHDGRRLVRHLRETAQLTPGLLLRALLSGQPVFFEDALVELSGLPVQRVAAIVQQGSAAARAALFSAAELPATTFAAFHEALLAQQEHGFANSLAGAAGLKRRIVERVLVRCASESRETIDPLMSLLRRFATEAAREEARILCDEMSFADENPTAADEPHAVADDVATSPHFAPEGVQSTDISDATYWPNEAEVAESNEIANAEFYAPASDDRDYLPAEPVFHRLLPPDEETQEKAAELVAAADDIFWPDNARDPHHMEWPDADAEAGASLFDRMDPDWRGKLRDGLGEDFRIDPQDRIAA